MMRKALFLVLMAASASVPAMPAWAQDDEARPSREERIQARQAQRQARQENRDADQPRQQRSAPVVQNVQPREERRVERREERREERRVERREDRREDRRVERREDRRTAPVATQPGQPLTGWIGDPNDPRMEAHRRRYERIDRQRVRENGTPEQYRALIESQRNQRGNVRDGRRDDRRDVRRDDRREARENRRAWNRDWRRDQRYDWRRYRDTNRFVFRVQPYYSPYRGYRYTRFSIGHILDRLFWGQNYWISNPWQYRLPPAPIGYQWVRYYDDVLLIDTYTGEVVDVIYEFFYR